jgi:hypothetical protein
MKLKMTKATNCDGVSVQAGDVVDASARDGRFLVASGFAELYEEPKRARPKKAPTNRMTDVEATRDAG